MLDMGKVADEIIRDGCEKPVPALDRLRLHDALSEFSCELDANAEGRGFNEVRLAEAIVNRPENYPDMIAERVNGLMERYGYGDDY